MTDFEDRDQRLADGAEELAAHGDSSVTGQRQFLLVASGALMTLGLTAIVLGWIGASRSTLVEEQVPYLISGGLFGVALSVIGALSFFSHWFVTGIREARAHEIARQRDHAELIAAISSLTNALVNQEGIANGAARSSRPARSLRRSASR
jgi:hypothetical protein